MEYSVEVTAINELLADSLIQATFTAEPPGIQLFTPSLRLKISKTRFKSPFINWHIHFRIVVNIIHMWFFSLLLC